VEDNTLTTEQTTFQNYPTGGNRSSLELFDHTDFSGSVYTRSQLLNGGSNSQVGLSKSLKVYPGDVIHAEVYAKYWNVTSNSSNIAGFAAALTGAFGVTAVMTGEAGKAFSALNSYGGAVAGAGGSGSPTAPKAFITVLLFDNNFNFVDVAYDQIDVNAQQVGASPKAAFDLLVRDVTIKEPGYAYIYISNENPTQVDVFFDDLSITHTKTNVVQYSEYYPFGMQTSNSWTRENTKGNQFLYNQGTESNATTGWYDLFFRNYDPTLGRFAQVDPLASQYHNQTTYQYGNNDPVYWSDPSGASSGDAYGDQLMRGNQTAALTFQNFVDAAFAARNDHSTMFGGSWNVLTYGSPDVGGSMFAERLGVIYPGTHGSASFAEFEQAMHIALQGGKVVHRGGKYWVDVQIEEYVNDPQYTGWAPGVMTFEVGKQTQGGGPLKENLGKAIPLDEWAERYEGQSYFKIITEAGWKDGMPLGPKARYVINPKDNNVMDMRHVMVVGFGLGNPFGDIIEFGQSLIPSKRPSAYNPQDYYSNDIGNSFAWFYFQYVGVTADWTTTFQSWMSKD
jgi:RHS repeat-associated protein